VPGALFRFRSRDPKKSDQEDAQLLGQRLAVFGKILTVANLAFFAGFQLLWSREPTVGGTRAWSATSSAASIFVQATYVAVWLASSSRGWSHGALRIIDFMSSLALGLGFLGITFAHPAPDVSIWEVGMALTVVLMLRALLVPSSAAWTLLLGLVTTLPSSVGILAQPDHFTTKLADETLFMLIVNRSVVAIVCSTAASSILYGLRREVRAARRLGQYTLEERLGAGGMGIVYRARHAMLRRPTAVKLLRDRASTSLARFEREVQQMAALSHPNIVAVHDYGRTEDGVFYYAMEYLDGLDLEQLAELDGPLPGARVIHLLRQTCAALAEAHQAGILHRDIKPANIYACRGRALFDHVKVLDFGLLKDLTLEPTAELTLVNAIMGTPLYVAPESLSHAVPLDPRTDLYSVGAVAYRLLSGCTVFDGATAVELCAHHLHTPPRPLRERTDRPIAEDLEAIVMRCLEKEPSKRFASAAELDGALAQCVQASEWTPALAQTWWEEAETRIDAWRTQHRSERSPPVDSLLVEAGARAQ
jgi:eukaryotic-like serine/threonine-protein kinase